jgi:hypothetical protein
MPINEFAIVKKQPLKTLPVKKKEKEVEPEPQRVAASPY